MPLLQKSEPKTEIKWINSDECTDKNRCTELLNDVQGLIVPGGFGIKNVDGMINVITYARENNLPFLGICLGMQCAITEFARNVLKMKDANSTEFNNHTQYPVIDLLLEDKELKGYGGPMRCGAYDCKLKKGSKVQEAYGANKISERHKHRYEVNPEFVEDLQKAGMVFSGESNDGMFKEIMELPQLDWFVGCQFHPEFKSRPERPHPLFRELISSALKQK
jgi:CTP synthase